MLKGAGVKTGDEAVDYLMRRFLNVELHASRKQAIADFMKAEAGPGALDYSDSKTDATLRRLLYLILSAPEYQVA